MKTYIKPHFVQVSLSAEMLMTESTISLPFDETEHGKAEAPPIRNNWFFPWENSF